MDLQDSIARFKALQAKQIAFNHAMGVLNYDSETAMPRRGAGIKRGVKRQR